MPVPSREINGREFVAKLQKKADELRTELALENDTMRSLVLQARIDTYDDLVKMLGGPMPPDLL